MDISRLKECELFLFDMDGTLYLGDDVYPGARELMETLHRLTPPMSMDGLAVMMLENAANEQGGEWMY